MEGTESTSQELSEIEVRPVERSEEAQYQEQMRRHHYLGALAKIGEAVWYVATWRGQWVVQYPPRIRLHEDDSKFDHALMQCLRTNLP